MFTVYYSKRVDVEGEGWRERGRVIEGVRCRGEVEVGHMLPRLFLHDNAQDGNYECNR